MPRCEVDLAVGRLSDIEPFLAGLEAEDAAEAKALGCATFVEVYRWGAISGR